MGACIGPLARRVEDLGLLFSVMARRSEDVSSPEVMKENLRIAWFGEDGVSPVAREIVKAVRNASAILRDTGCDVREEVPPGFSEGQRLWVELFSRAAAEQIRQIYVGRELEAGPVVSALFRSTVETAVTDKIETQESLAKAVLERERRREELLRWMRTTPVIISPVSATPAFEHGAKQTDVDGESVSVFRSCSYSQTINVFGLPAVVVPVARTTAGLPIGVQIIGRPFREFEVLAVAATIERLAGF